MRILFSRFGKFDICAKEVIGASDLVKILKGGVAKPADLRDATYFVVCRNGIEQLSGEGRIVVDGLKRVVSDVFDKSAWFGKFGPDKIRIIVPGRYDLAVNPVEKQVLLEASANACYYNSGNLQLDKDYSKRVLRTDIGVEELKRIVVSSCSDYQYSDSLKLWR